MIVNGNRVCLLMFCLTSFCAPLKISQAHLVQNNMIFLFLIEYSFLFVTWHYISL